MAKDERFVYGFGPKGTDGDASMRALLGGKGANLAEMTNIGLPVPAGFTITTDVCTYYYAHDRSYPPELKSQVDEAMAKIEKVMGAKFGATTNPLLVSCRSGARDSMPGMMDTVLNIGLNDRRVEALAKQSGNERFAWDSYRRFVQMYGDVVLDLKPKTKNDHDPFEELLEAKKKQAGVKLDTELTADAAEGAGRRVQEGHQGRHRQGLPQRADGADVGRHRRRVRQLDERPGRRLSPQYGIPHEWGTAVNVQAMVFGNLGDDCATGVALTRDAALGEPGFNGDYLINAQGEDVVAGIRTPQRIEETLAKDMPQGLQRAGRDRQEARKALPRRAGHRVHGPARQGLDAANPQRQADRLRRRAHRRRHGQRRADHARKRRLSAKRIPADDLNQLLQPIFDPEAKEGRRRPGSLLAKGINAGPGAATGKICFHASDAEAAVAQGQQGRS